MLLALSACNKVETEIQPVPGEEGITITATLAPKGANTKAVADGGDKITVTWAENEHIAVLYEVNSTKYVADATITAVDGSGTATITFTVEAGTPNNTDCTLVYPLSAAKDDHSGVKDAATLLAAQDGTLSANLDVRVGAGTIQTTTPGLTVTTQPAAQFAIFKFTVKNSDASATIDVKPLTITIGAQDYVITPASATSELFVALPAISGEAVSFTATGSDSKTYTASKASVTFSAGKYYQSIIKMAEAAPAAATGHALSASAVGEVVGTDGMAYDVADKDNLPTGVTAAGMVAYKSGSDGLVIALADEASTMNWSTANGASGAAAHTPTVTGQTWKLPSQAEWQQMFSANGGNQDSYTGLNTALAAAGGDSSKLQEYAFYWSSSEFDPGVDAYDVVLYGGDAGWGSDDEDDDYRVRACLAFTFTPAAKAAAEATAEDIGKVIGADGNIYADAAAATAASTTAVATIVYVGSDNGEDAPNNHGLALAMSDADGGAYKYWGPFFTDAGHSKQTDENFTTESGLQYNATHNTDDYPAFKAAIANNSTAAPTGCSAWFLASGYQWKKMFAGNASDLQTLAGLQSDYYWSSSEYNANYAWGFETDHGWWYGDDGKNTSRLVRACLAF